MTTRLKACLLWAGILSVVGCAQGDKKVVPVTGIVTRNGEPVSQVTLHFVPQSGRPSWARSDEQGRFTLDYDPQRKGAEVGRHKVWVEFRPASPEEEDLLATGKLRPPKDRKEILEKYGNANDPKIEIDITRDTRVIEIKLD